MRTQEVASLRWLKIGLTITTLAVQMTASHVATAQDSQAAPPPAVEQGEQSSDDTEEQGSTDEDSTVEEAPRQASDPGETEQPPVADDEPAPAESASEAFDALAKQSCDETEQRLDRARERIENTYVRTAKSSKAALGTLENWKEKLDDAAEKLEQQCQAARDPSTDEEARANRANAEKGLVDTLENAKHVAELAEAEADKLRPAKTGYELVGELLEARCRTAICFDAWGMENWLGIEPLIELPVGKSFALSEGGLADYVNNHNLRIDFTAGLRVWVYRDWISGSVYLSQPLTDRSLRITGSSYEYPASALRRPYPGVALGVFFDTLWIALDRDELRNTDSVGTSDADPAYPPNGLVDGCWTLTIALQPLTAFRTAIGSAVNEKEEPK